jgi:hypothetical protein
VHTQRVLKSKRTRSRGIATRSSRVRRATCDVIPTPLAADIGDRADCAATHEPVETFAG